VRGKKLRIIGKSLNEDSRHAFFDETIDAKSDEWEKTEFTLECPRAGLYRVEYWLADDELKAEQTVVAGWTEGSVVRECDENRAFYDMQLLKIGDKHLHKKLR
jgi:hypothetical protein